MFHFYFVVRVPFSALKKSLNFWTSQHVEFATLGKHKEYELMLSKLKSPALFWQISVLSQSAFNAGNRGQDCLVPLGRFCTA